MVGRFSGRHLGDSSEARELSRIARLGRTEVVIYPAAEYAARRRLFNGLERLFLVSFVAEEQAPNERVPAIGFTTDPASTAVAAGCRHLVYLETAQHHARPGLPETVRFSDSHMLDSRLTDQSLPGKATSHDQELPDHLGDVLATRNGNPFWRGRETNGSRVDVILNSPAELGATESLRERCGTDGPTLIPLIQLLRDATGYSEWHRPPLRASFLIDDPNLHRPTYGFVKFAELARYAYDQGCHVAFATIPLDAWYSNREAAAIFGRAKSQLSLTVHGNDHVYRELETVGSEEAAVKMLGIAIARIHSLEQKTGLRVARVMVPPHGVTSDSIFAPLVATRFDALCRAQGWWCDRDEDMRTLGGWGMADISKEGLPVILRHPSTRTRP